VFPFSILHPNTGSLICQKILLLPKFLTNNSALDQGGQQSIDLTPNTSASFVPIIIPQVPQQIDGENFVQNGAEMDENEEDLELLLEDTSGPGSEDDTPKNSGESALRSAPDPASGESPSPPLTRVRPVARCNLANM
jgi:hypothetical protein